MEKKYAILVVDMLNDFVTGALKCDRGLAIVPKTAELVKGAREKNIPVIFCNDARLFHFSYQRYLENLLAEGDRIKRALDDETSH